MNLHILRGTGKNCTCLDCIVLYGGECQTTRTNNFLDKLEQKVLHYLNTTPTGKQRKVSDSFMDSCINDVVRPMVRKHEKVHTNQFNRYYYGFMPLLYIMTSDRKEGARYWYRRARNWEYEKVIEDIKKASKDPIDYDD